MTQKIARLHLSCDSHCTTVTTIPIHSSNQSFLDLGVKINYSYENLIRNLVTRVCGCRADVLRITLSAENTAVSKRALRIVKTTVSEHGRCAHKLV